MTKILENWFLKMEPHHGKVLLRLEEETVANKILVLRQLLELHGENIAGPFTVVSENGVRMVCPPYPSKCNDNVNVLDITLSNTVLCCSLSL